LYIFGRHTCIVRPPQLAPTRLLASHDNIVHPGPVCSKVHSPLLTMFMEDTMGSHAMSFLEYEGWRATRPCTMSCCVMHGWLYPWIHMQEQKGVLLAARA